jgi:hypothetical protein
MAIPPNSELCTHTEFLALLNGKTPVDVTVRRNRSVDDPWCEIRYSVLETWCSVSPSGMQILHLNLKTLDSGDIVIVSNGGHRDFDWFWPLCPITIHFDTGDVAVRLGVVVD